MAMAPVVNGDLESLPAWARQLSEKYYSRTIALFVLYGNVRDLVPLRRGGATEAEGVMALLACTERILLRALSVRLSMAFREWTVKAATSGVAADQGLCNRFSADPRGCATNP